MVGDSPARLAEQVRTYGVDDVSSRGPSLRRPTGQDALRRLDAQLDRRAGGAHGPEVWISAVREALAARSAKAFDIAEQGLRAFPADPELLLIAALAALGTAAPDRALVLLIPSLAD